MKKSMTKKSAGSKSKAKAKDNDKVKIEAKSKAKSGSKSKLQSKSKSKASSKKVIRKSVMPSALNQNIKNVALKIANIFSDTPKDIGAAIKMDHDGLRNFMKVLKDTDGDMTERRRAYSQFVELLKSHTTAEEQAVYNPTAKMPGREMAIKIAEGFVEHKVTEDLMKRIEAAGDSLTWSAHANVLSETLEHHLAEEERDLLPLIRKTATLAKNAEMLEHYLSLREKTQTHTTPKNAGVLETVTDSH